ncbi:hypothetical protein GHT06_013987 [Daphnia sinensis]|uniref:Peroxiredoxin-like 2 activated in M-CSF stimulated monocytes n=1 Tax=Daphnia sinensis TaxID=1820382 RepID=A0AAD5PXH4_9CRUS|nr:hypothetical protein GHT06_013987 [Daphnia sinensis]
MFCRLAAQELSLLSPRLSQENVRLVGIGLEELGVEEFVEKKFWAGELYIDEKKKSFNDLGYKRFSIWSLPGLLLSRIARSQAAKGRERGVGGDLRGDGYQNGGLLVVGKGGKVLYSFVQENPADHAANEDILKALNLSPAGGEQATVAPSSAATCGDGDVCSVKPKSPASE